ncbi:MAG: hypothetical protein GY842_25410 [bacterium]|nr:hypothetical protein [bacterium]
MTQRAATGLVMIAILGVLSCTTADEPGEEGLSVTATVSECVGVGGFATLTASSADTEVLVYRWSLERKPEAEGDLAIHEPRSAITTTDELTVAGGEYIFRVTATDRSGRSDSAWATLTVDGPAGASGDFCVTLDGPGELGIDEEGTYSATVEREGTFTYSWEALGSNGAPAANVGFGSPTEAETTAVVSGMDELTVRVTVKDVDTGEVGVGQLALVVIEKAELTTPSPLMLSNAKVELTAARPDVSDDAEIRYFWEVAQGPGTLESAGIPGPQNTLTATGEGTIKVKVELLLIEPDGSRRIEGEVTVVTYAASGDNQRPRVDIELEHFGTVRMALEVDAAPNTVANFLQYVDSGFYNGTVMHRIRPSAPGLVLGGLFESSGGSLAPKEGVLPAIDSEAPNGLSNLRGMVGLALDEGDVDSNGEVSGNPVDPDSGAAAFFINLIDNAELDAAPRRTVFAEVLDGLEVLDAIGQVVTAPRAGIGDSVPVEDVVIQSVGRAGGISVSISGSATGTVDERLELTASAQSAVGTVSYAWRVEAGEANLDDDDQETVGVTPTAAGELIIEVTATDGSTQEQATASQTITVEEAAGPLAITATGPDILLVGDEGQLSAEVEDAEGFDEINYAWEVVAGDATLDNQLVAEPMLTAEMGETVQLRVSVTALNGTDARTGETELYVVTIAQERPQVVYTITGFGDVVFEMREDLTPKTVANLLRYVDDGFYSDTVIHRVVPDFVIQAGGYRIDDNGEYQELDTRDPVVSEAETALSNTVDTVAMALSGGNADSGTSQWFINLTDNSASLDGQNFTAFATLVEGKSVVEAIAAVDTETNPLGGEASRPVTPVVIESAARR